ncbi:MAG: hypothetical protein ACRC9T_07890, partial [Vibrionaceae bacterium]
WDGAFTTFGFLLDINPHAVKSWQKAWQEGFPTVVDRSAGADGPFSAAAMAAPLSIPLPMDLLSWPEVARFLLSRFAMQLAPEQTQAQSQTAEASFDQNADVTAQPLIMRLSFSEDAIKKQELWVRQLMQDFNRGRVAKVRDKLFARIVCILKEALPLPFGTFSRVCELLGITSSSVSAWCGDYKIRITAAQAANQGPSAKPATTSIAVPSLAVASSSSAPLQTFVIPQAASASVRQNIATTVSTSSAASATIVRQQMQPLSASATLVSLAREVVQPATTMPCVSLTPAAAVSPSQVPLQTLMTHQIVSKFVPQSAATRACVPSPARVAMACQPPLILPAAASVIESATTAASSTQIQVKESCAAAPAFTSPATSVAPAQLAPALSSFIVPSEGEEEESEKMQQETGSQSPRVPLSSLESEEVFSMLIRDDDLIDLAAMDEDELYSFLEADGGEQEDLDYQQQLRELQQRQAKPE